MGVNWEGDAEVSEADIALGVSVFSSGLWGENISTVPDLLSNFKINVVCSGIRL